VSAQDPVRHERGDLNARSVVRAAVVLVAMTLVAIVVTVGTFRLLRGLLVRADLPRPALADHAAERQPPEPRLQREPFGDVGVLRAEERAVLEGYGWVDREQGVVHIPVEHAMQLYLERNAAAGGGQP